MLDLINESPWTAGVYAGWGRDRRHQMTVVVKAGFRFDMRGVLSAEYGVEMETSERHHGDALMSGLAAASDIVPFKAGGELLLSGTAYPAGRDIRAVKTEVALVFADGRRWLKSLRITGRRHWQRKLLMMLPGDPEPMEPTPIRYEYAYGGIDQARHALEARNPVGLGFAKYGRVANGQEMARIEKAPAFITKPSDHPEPSGYGPIAAGWQPRRSEAENVDEEALAAGLCPYQREPSPILFNCAPPDQRFPKPFVGDETLTLRGFFQELGDAPVTLRLPRLRPEAHLSLEGELSPVSLACDTLLVDTELRTVSLLWRGAIPWRRADTRSGWVLLRDAEAEQQEVV